MARRDPNRARARKPDARRQAADAERRRRRRFRNRRFAGIGLGALLVALFAFVAIASGLGDPEPSGETVAIVEDAPDGTITQEELTTELERVPQASNLEPGSARYQDAAQQVLDQLILGSWVQGEAAQRGIEVSERELDQRLEQTIQEQFGGQEGYERFLEQQSFTEEEVLEQLRLVILSEEVQNQLAPSEPEITDDQLEQVYEANSDQFTTPESRDVRLVLTRTAEEAEQALAELEQDGSEENFARVARELSIDEATRSTGGLRQGVVAGQSDPALDEAIFSAPEGELVGPIETEGGFYVFRVESITPEETQALEDVEEDLRASLAGTLAQQQAEDAAVAFGEEWRERTFCADEYVIPRCANFEQPNAAAEACTEDVAIEAGCEAPVPSLIPAPPQAFEVPTAAPDDLAPPPTPPTPAWEVGAAELSGNYAPGLAQNAFREPPAEGQETPTGLPPGGLPPTGAPPGAVPPTDAPPTP